MHNNLGGFRMKIYWFDKNDFFPQEAIIPYVTCYWIKSIYATVGYKSLADLPELGPMIWGVPHQWLRSPTQLLLFL